MAKVAAWVKKNPSYALWLHNCTSISSLCEQLAFKYRPLVADMYISSIRSIGFRRNLVTHSLAMFLPPSSRSGNQNP